MSLTFGFESDVISKLMKGKLNYLILMLLKRKSKRDVIDERHQKLRKFEEDVIMNQF